MAKTSAPRIKKSRSELLDDLAEQIDILVTICAAFDAGKASMAKPISSVLAILLNGDRDRSLSLLHQLGIRQKRFLDTTRPLAPGLKRAQCQLAAIFIEAESSLVSYIPYLSNTPYPVQKTQFVNWWSDPVVRDSKGRTFSRMNLVQEVRNTDGGGHLDEGLNEPYADFKSGLYLGWQVKTGKEIVPIPHPHLACIRQIAHETLLTLEYLAKEQFRAPYIYPMNALGARRGLIFAGMEGGPTDSDLTATISIGGVELIGAV